MKTIATLILITLTFCCINSASAQWMGQDNPSSTDLWGASFINSNTGWMCGYNGSLVKTTNGGTNWVGSALVLPDNFTRIHFFDANTGILLGSGGITGGSKAYKSTNGGANWVEILSASDRYNDIFFVDANTGWIIDGVSIYKTTDACISWTFQKDADGLLTDLYFLNSSMGWAAQGNGTVIKTTNGGDTWTSINTGASEWLQTVSFSDVNNGRVTGNNGAFLRTTNGGTNWSSLPVGGIYSVTGQYFMNASTGWVIGQLSAFFTSNGGTTWISQIWPDAHMNLCFTGSGTGYIVGNHIYKTTTGGFNLQAPTNLILTATSTSSINLSWTDNSPDENKFMIERSSDGNNWNIIDSVNAGVTSYQNTGLSSEQLYYYRVYGKKIIFTSGYSNTPSLKTPMTAPSLSSPEAGTVIPAVPVLQWTAVPNAFTYTLVVASDTNFTNMVYAITAPGITSFPVPPANLQNSTRYYWRVKVASLTNQSLFTPYRDFIIQDPNYGHNISSGNNLYYFANSTSGASLSPSKPTYNWRDTTGSTTLVANGSYAPISAGTQANARFDLTGKLPAGHSIKFFGTNYQDLYIGTNGIIAFSSFVPNFVPNISPESGLPQSNILSAIFPLWAKFNFSFPTVTGSRLSYKITSDEIIITFTKAPINPDPNYYVSFQVVINHSASPSTNSVITMQYNYDQTGSSFIASYGDNTLGSHLIGLQGGNSAVQCFQYRYLNSFSNQLISSGPMFGSNLALQFGPDATSLPVELSSFTSLVNNSNVKLEWSTVNEQNNSGFDIERKISGSNEWKKINFVQGNGTTNEAKNYSYEDRNITSGKYQYRLKQIDFNGNYEYHELANEVEIGVPKKFNLSQNYPNPFNPSTKINYELPAANYVSIKIFDLTGKEVAQLVNENKAAGYYTVEFNITNLSSGMYFYRIQAGDFSAVKKMILVK